MPSISTGDEASLAKEPEKVIPTPVPDEPQVSVQEMPSFTGGEAELYSFLSKSLKYPYDARDLGVQGKVYVEFIVERDGSISNVRIKRGIGAGCDEEAARVVSLMPKWNPGKQNGQPVRVLFVLPIRFVLN
ncbi:MAG: TonB family protein [Bacteroidetes bacterium]|nr:TonB family protein [Bacteroidota bacterium]